MALRFRFLWAAALGVSVVSVVPTTAVGRPSTIQQGKPSFQATVTKRKQAIMDWVRDVSETQKQPALQAALAGLDATTLKALDQQVTLEWQQYMLKPESRTPNGVRIIGRFKQAQTTVRTLMAKAK